MWLAEGQPDRQISIESVWRWFLDSVFAIHRRSALEPKAIRLIKMHTKSTLFTSKMHKLKKTSYMKINTAEGEFARQIPMRNQLFTCIIKTGEKRWQKSGLASGLRIDKYRYIEVARVISYRFFTIGRLVRRFFGLKCDY